MKILLVAPHYPPRYIGGVELIAQRLAHRLRAAGHAVCVIAVERVGVEPQDPQLAEVTDDDGVTVWRLSLPRSLPQPHEPDGETAFEASYRPRGAEAFIRNWLARERPDVIHLHSGYLLGGAVLQAAAARGIPVVVTLHDYWFICPRITMLQPGGACCTGPESAAKCAWCLATEQRRYRLPERLLGAPVARALAGAATRAVAAPPLRAFNLDPLRTRARVRDIEQRNRLLQASLRGAAAIISPSRFLRDQMAMAGVPSDRITLLPYGLEPGPRLARRAPDHVALRVGFLGQIAPHKGVHVLIEAVRMLHTSRALRGRRVELIIQGDLTRERDYVRQLRALAAAVAADDDQEDSRVVFAGPIVDRRLEALFNRIDILAVPSVWYENAPLVMLEAKRAGLPVLASRLGGMAELVRDGEGGLLAEAGSPSSFARQLQRLIDEPDLIDHFRQQITPPSSIDDEVSALLDIYARVSRAEPALLAMTALVAGAKGRC